MNSHREPPALKLGSTARPASAGHGRILPLFEWPDLLLLVAGLALNLLASLSIIPVFAFLISFALGLVFLSGVRWNRREDLKIYVRCFLVYWMCSGISALFRVLLNDQSQLVGDAANFFMFATTDVGGMTLVQIRNHFSEGAAAIKIWHAIYTAAAWIGIKAVPSLGISFNTLVTALSAVVVLRSAECVSGLNFRTYRFIQIAFSTCGLLGLVASIHLRDALILPLVSGLSLAWIRYCVSPTHLGRLLIAALCSAGAAPLLYFLRAELVYVPLLLMVVAAAAILVRGRIAVPRVIRVLALVVATLVGSYATYSYTSVVDNAITKGRQTYSTKVEQTASDGSLGAALIVNQPLPVRAVAGTIYLFIFPVPVWAGLTFGTSYMLFKSATAIFFYFTLPMVALGVRDALFGKRASASGTFVALSSVIIPVAIALSSLESRHLVPFLGLLFMTATIPDLSNRRTRILLRSLTVVFISLMALLHLTWGVLKFV